ncbi:ATP-binding domain-containing protein [Stenotrophomonas forensis]
MMNKSWWRSKLELDEHQKNFIRLPTNGRYSLVGPPGSGKTNLLLLRALFIAGSGEKNVLIITYSKALADFIRTGISSDGSILPTQVKTYHSWASGHILEHLGHFALPKDADFNEDSRKEILEMLKAANQRIPTKRLFSAIFVDEAQDLTAEELGVLLTLSDNVCICGDDRQGIYNRDGLTVSDKLGLEVHTLTRHFRIGHRIARVADRLMPPPDESDGLEATSNYNSKVQGESSAHMHPCESREQQFERMIQSIRIQLDAFKDDSIGIFCPTRDALAELRDRFNETELKDKICVHSIDDDSGFGGSELIHALTLHAAKGTEFRAVHIFATEEMAKFPLNRRKLGYTAITRAKTALNAYRTGDTNRPLENAFAEPKHMDLDDLFPGDEQ